MNAQNSRKAYPLGRFLGTVNVNCDRSNAMSIRRLRGGRRPTRLEYETGTRRVRRRQLPDFEPGVAEAGTGRVCTRGSRRHVHRKVL